MSRGVRAAAVVLVVLSVLLGLPSAAVAQDGATAARVLVVGVPGLTWNDVDAAKTPQLWSMAEHSAIGSLSVRAARSTTCTLDGWATLGAGNRARVPGPGSRPASSVDTTLSHCGLQEQAAGTALTDPETEVERTAEDEGTARFGAEPGALGRAVGCATVAGRGPALAVAVPGVTVRRVDPLPTDAAGLTGLLTGCPLTLVTLDQLTDAARPGVDTTGEGTPPAARAAALRRLDGEVGRLRAAVAAVDHGATLVLLAGISEVNDGRPQLHVGMASGPGFDATGWLTSASTGRAPFVQLIDLAPTALQTLGREQPASMNGQPMRSSGGRPELSKAVAELDAVNTAATVHHRNTGVFFWTLVLVSAALVTLGMLVLGGVPGRWVRVRPGGRRPLRGLAVAAAALPGASYLAGLVPWEHTDAPVPVLIAALVAADVVVAAVALRGPWRPHRLGPALAVLTLTVGTLLADVLTGSTLELNGMLGYDAIVAGRFTGYGNLTFGLMSVSALSVAAALATLVARRVAPGRARLAAGATVLVLGGVVVGVIGAPGLGRDFGGVLAALPGFLVLAMLLARVRVTVVRLLAVLAAAVVAVGAV
ncbi:MAG TPA: hypothetical protein VGN28_16960, partial [Blastococcus sp.]|nr:hypothetical protein [Blastococcus sp.]